MHLKGVPFHCEDVHVAIEGKQIVKGVTLTINPGEIHALMGPNGSGKSTLANALMGHPSYDVTSGRVYVEGEDITELEPHEKSIKGMFLAFQYPLAVPGVTVANFLRAAMKARRTEEEMRSFRKDLKREFKNLGIDEAFATRYVNDGFSGGEKKRLEILQMAMLKPRVALLDETDSGLDIDALQVVAEGINRVHSDESATLMVTHYQRLLRYVEPHVVHVFMDGRIVRTGGPELALELEERGYDWIENGVSQTAGVA